MRSKHQNELRTMPRKALCLAIAAAFASPLWAAEDDEVERLVKPESNFSLGVGQVSGDNQRFGVYNGLNKDGTVGLADFSVVRRDDDADTWFRARGRNLGLDNRELRLEHERQGDWGYFVDFSQTPRVSPYEIHTNLHGLGTTSQSYPAYTPTNASPTLPTSTAPGISLKTARETTKLGFNKAFSSELEFRVVFQNEEKEGNRIFGRGTGSTFSVEEFLAEPIRSTTRQFDAVLDYTGEKLQLSGGYYGSFYNNHNSVLNVAGGASPLTAVGNTGVPFDRIALPPDNSAHQFHLSGGYQFTNTTRGSFKVAKTIGLQNDDFMAVRFLGASADPNANNSGRSNLGGRLDTTLVQLGLTSRPVPGLFLLGNLRYENRDDKTDLARYLSNVSYNAGTHTFSFSPFTGSANPTLATNGFNEPRSLSELSGKFEASYQLPQGFRLVGGVDRQQKDHSTSGIRIVGYRERTDETTYRAELKRTMGETLTGSIAYLHSDRTGSDFRNLTTLGGYTYPNYSPGSVTNCATLSGVLVTRCGLVQPIYMADRERDKVRMAMDWAPLDALSAQFAIEESRDDYGRGRGNPDIGPRKGDAHLYSVDLVYTLTENWKLTGWASRSDNQMDQASIAFYNGTYTESNKTIWSAEMKNLVDSFALGTRGKMLNGKLDVGADYVYARDLSKYKLNRDNNPTSPAAVSDLSDITYKQTTIKLFGRYFLSKDLAMRLDYIFDHRKNNDWTWNTWTYSDGTLITQKPDDKVHFIGVSANYSFR